MEVTANVRVTRRGNSNAGQTPGNSTRKASLFLARSTLGLSLHAVTLSLPRFTRSFCTNPVLMSFQTNDAQIHHAHLSVCYENKKGGRF